MLINVKRTSGEEIQNERQRKGEEELREEYVKRKTQNANETNKQNMRSATKEKSAQKGFRLNWLMCQFCLLRSGVFKQRSAHIIIAVCSYMYSIVAIFIYNFNCAYILLSNRQFFAGIIGTNKTI